MSFTLSRTELIAEIGLAHEGSLWLAHSYIDAVAEAGATAVKFQAHTPLESSPDETWRVSPPTGEPRAAYWQRTAFTREQWMALAEHARQKRLRFGVSVFHDSLVEPLAPFVDFWKVPSGAVVYSELLTALSKFPHRTYIADGLHPVGDLPLRWTRLICTSQYPTPVGHTGVNEIRPGLDGLSDHSGEPITAALAAYQGAVAVEVHVTFDRRTGLPDAKASLTLDGLAEAARLMALAVDAKRGRRPTPDAALVARVGYREREGVWCKPA